MVGGALGRRCTHLVRQGGAYRDEQRRMAGKFRMDLVCVARCDPSKVR